MDTRRLPDAAVSRRALLAAALAAAAAPAAHARPADAAAVDRALAQQPLYAPFFGVDDSTGNVDAPAAVLRGRWPAELRGRFYRNGPALLQRGGERYHHWFDGDGMVQQFSIGDGRISHRGRLVQTPKLQAERRAGRFLRQTLGTYFDDADNGGGPDAYNVANTNALEHAGRVLAMWEGGSAFALDPKDLSTQGPVTWRDDLQQMPFSAHPKLTSDGHLWNFGTMGENIVAWHIDPAGKLAGVQAGKSPYPGGMVHDMAVTPRYLVVPLPPVKLAFGQPSDGPRRFAMEPGQPLRVLVMDKADIQRQRVFELPPQMLFHVGNAHETRDGGIEFNFIGAPDAWFLDRGAVAVMAGETLERHPLALNTVRLDMRSGRATMQSLPGDLEFPRIHPQRIGLPARWLVTATSWRRRNTTLFHGVQLIDTASGRSRRFDYGDDAAVEEHVFVPKPGKRGELDAWLMGTTYDARRRATVLNLIDAARIEDGPVAQAILPYVLPLGFHGNFTAA